jgi:hypothetical protein
MMIALMTGKFVPECHENQLLGMAFDSSAKALRAEALDFAREARSLHSAGSSTRGEPMKVVDATNTLRPLGDGETPVLNLRGAAPDRAGETGVAAM